MLQQLNALDWQTAIEGGRYGRYPRAYRMLEALGEPAGMAWSFMDGSAYVKGNPNPSDRRLTNVNDLFAYNSPGTKYAPNAAGIFVPGTTMRTWYENGAALGVKFEPTRQGLFLNSALAGGASGVPGTAPTSWAFTASAGSSIAGTAGVLFELPRFGWAADAGARHFSAQSVTLTAATTYTLTMFIELAAPLNMNQLGTPNPSPNASTYTYAIDGGATFTNGSTAVPAGRHVITVTIASGDGGTLGWRMGVGTSGALAEASTLFVDYAQIELGTDSSSPIITAGAPVTRNADNVDVLLSDFPFGPNMTFFADIQLRSHNDANSRIFALNGGSACFMNRTGNLSQVQVFDGEVDGDVISHGAGAPYSTPGKAVTVFAGLDTAACAVLITGNGATPTTGVQDDWPARIAAATRLKIGSQAGSTNMNGWFREGLILPRAMSPAEAQAFAA